MAGNSVIHKLLLLWINNSSLNILLTHYMPFKVVRLLYSSHVTTFLYSVILKSVWFAHD